MKTNKKVQKMNSVQKSEKETAVKVTALAIIPKPMTLLSPQNMPTTAGITEAPETVTVPTRCGRNTATNHAQDTACNDNG